MKHKQFVGAKMFTIWEYYGKKRTNLIAVVFNKRDCAKITKALNHRPYQFLKSRREGKDGA